MSQYKLQKEHCAELHNDIHFIVMMKGEYKINFIRNKNKNIYYSLTTTNKRNTCDFMHLISYTKRELSELLETIFVHANIPLHKIDLLMECMRKKRTKDIKFYVDTNKKELEIR